MNKVLKSIIGVFSFVAVISTAIGYSLFTKKREGVEDVETKIKLTSDTLISEYELNDEAADSKYSGKIIEVSGVINTISLEKDGVNVYLRGSDLGGVCCQLDSMYSAPYLKPGDSVTIKGLCTGLLMDVVMLNCVVVHPN